MVRDNLLKFTVRQLSGLPAVESRDLGGKVVIITGSNIGLGKEAARHLAAMNPARLIIAVRSVEKGEAAAKEIIETTQTKAKIDVWPLDLSSFSSVKAFADRVDTELDRLDIFLENAGIGTMKYERTGDGYETTLQINVISTAWLALRVLPLLQKTAKKQEENPMTPHLTIVASEMHHWASSYKGHDADNPIAYLNDPKNWAGADRYNITKLIDVFIARELAIRAGPEIIVNSVNPGLCESEIFRNVPFPVSWIAAGIKRTFARTAEAGSRNYVWAVLNNSGSGAYVADCQVTGESNFVLSPEGKATQTKIWAEILAIIAKHDSKAIKDG